MKLLCVHAHFDDFEFVAGGTFELWRRRFGPNLRTKLIVCTDGCAGHQFRTREETGRMRLAEQLAAARLGGHEFELLRLPDGRTPREGCLNATPDVLAGLWHAIRGFQPDYLFCPPLAADPLAGVHVDHLGVAEAVRKVAYLLNVPHAYTPEYPVADESRSEPCRTPVIINVYDGYQGGDGGSDLGVDVGAAFDLIAEMSWCHQSQIREWLPWVGRHDLSAPADLPAWKETLRQRMRKTAHGQGVTADGLFEFFNVTAWGTAPTLEQLEKDFPNLARGASNYIRLRQRLARWA